MTFIDWSDAEDMFGLLIEYVSDARAEAGDRQRGEFLSGLLQSLERLQDRFPAMSPAARVAALRELQRSVDPQFDADPVTSHLADCATELERLSEDGA